MYQSLNVHYVENHGDLWTNDDLVPFCYDEYMTDTTTSIGAVGEEVAVEYLTSSSFKILERNFRRPHGELDIVAKKDEVVFVEVKSVRCRVPEDIPEEGSNNHRPEENVGKEKRERLRRIIQTYLKKFGVDGPWRCDLLCVYLDEVQQEARVKHIKNIII